VVRTLTIFPPISPSHVLSLFPSSSQYFDTRYWTAGPYCLWFPMTISTKQMRMMALRSTIRRQKRTAALRKEMLRTVGQGVPAVKAPRLYKSRSSDEPRADYWKSNWGRMLLAGRCRIPGAKKGGKRFRRRFRVPFPVFSKILELVRGQKWFSEAKDASGRDSAPLELKVLGVLRVLGTLYIYISLSPIP
jgi:hypothetical protein